MTLVDTMGSPVTWVLFNLAFANLIKLYLGPRLEVWAMRMDFSKYVLMADEHAGDVDVSEHGFESHCNRVNGVQSVSW